MRPSGRSALGRLMSIGSSATNTRPSGAQATTDGCVIFGASATTSIFQSVGGCGRAEVAADSQKTTKETKTAGKNPTRGESRAAGTGDDSIVSFVFFVSFCDVHDLLFTAIPSTSDS